MFWSRYPQRGSPRPLFESQFPGQFFFYLEQLKARRWVSNICMNKSDLDNWNFGKFVLEWNPTTTAAVPTLQTPQVPKIVEPVLAPAVPSSHLLPAFASPQRSEEVSEDIRIEMRGEIPPLSRIEKGENGRYACPDCERDYASVVFLVGHYQATHAHIYYRCSVCEGVTTNERSVKVHIRESHGSQGYGVREAFSGDAI